MYLKLSEIDAVDRIREDYGEEEMRELELSLSRHGQLQEAVVERREDGTYRLLAGGRRFKALTNLYAAGKQIPHLPPESIRCDIRENMQPHTRMLLEAEENFKRKDFTFLEKAKFIRAFHELMSKEYDEVWTAELTAHSLGVSPASISHYLRVEEAARTDETVAKAATLDAAVKRMKVVERTQARIEAVKKDNAEVLKRAQHILSKGDCRDWIDKFPDEGADLCNFDPPWGGDISHRVQEHNESFDDSTEYADKLIDEMLPQIYRVLRPDRFMIFWIDSIRIEELKERCRKVGFNFTFTEQACIWFKPDKTNSHNRYPEKQPHSVYEQFLLCRKGDPIFYDKPVLNVFPYNRVSRATQIHPTEKPIELCQRLVKLCTVPGEVLIDPTAGSSAFLDAAIRSNRKAHGCELSDSYYDRGIARLASYLETFTPA